jgi:ketosteroid isomerase-like protein
VSDTHVELVRKAVEAFARNDRDEAWAMWADDATTIAPKEWPEARGGSDLGEIRETFDTFDEAFGPDWPKDLTVERVEDLGGGRVLVEQDWNPSGVSSGAAVSGEIASLFTVADGKITHAVFFMSHVEARKEAGLQ